MCPRAPRSVPLPAQAVHGRSGIATRPRPAHAPHSARRVTVTWATAPAHRGLERQPDLGVQIGAASAGSTADSAAARITSANRSPKVDAAAPCASAPKSNPSKAKTAAAGASGAGRDLRCRPRRTAAADRDRRASRTPATICRKRSAASSFPGLSSGWNRRASRRYARLISPALAPCRTPRVTYRFIEHWRVTSDQ